MTQIMNPEHDSRLSKTVPMPSSKLFMKWGEEKIRKMVRYHHNLLRLSAIEHFLPEEEAQFEHATQKTADFFVDVLSGGISLQELLGYPALKMRFFQITVDETARDVWLEMYKKVIIDMNMPSECIEEFWNWIEPLSLWMINHQTMPQIPRYPYQKIWTDLVEFSQCRRCY